MIGQLSLHTCSDWSLPETCEVMLETAIVMVSGPVAGQAGPGQGGQAPIHQGHQVLLVILRVPNTFIHNTSLEIQFVGTINLLACPSSCVALVEMRLLM